jgi:hypothetical protein
MEYDRYQQNSKLFILSIICLFGSITSIGFGLYILPPLLWGIHYGIPEFLFTTVSYLQEVYKFSATTSTWLVLLCFLIPGFIMGFVSYLLSTHIENAIYHIEPKHRTEEEQQNLKESTGFGLKILSLMIIMLILIFLLQWLISA